MTDRPQAEVYHDLAFTEKDNYLKFIYDIGEKGLKEKFRFPGEDFSLWWFSRVVEKSPLKSDTYKDLISFLTSGDDLHRKKGILTRYKETAWFQFLSGLCLISALIVKAAYIRIMVKNSAERKKGLSRKDYYIFSYFPLIDEKSAEKDVFENLYIAPFHRILEDKFRGNYSHIFFQADINGYGLRDSVRLANRFAKRQSVFFLEEFFKIAHLVTAVFYYFYFSVLFLINLRRIKAGVIYERNGETHNVWHIFRSDFYKSFCGPGLASSIWYILLFREVVEGLNKDSKIICICEMQWWEKALYAYAKKRGITTIGAQHTIVPELLLNYFSDPREIGDGNFMKYCPFPDYLATVGKTSSDVFTGSGWPAERIFTWGAQRFESLKNMMLAPVPWKDKENRFVCAFSVNVAEVERLLLLIKDAFAGVKDYKIVLRSHPAADLGKKIKSMALKLDSSVFEFTDEPLQDIIRKAKGIIVVSSSSCLYALACDIPVIVPIFPDRIDYNPLSYISDIPVYVYSADQLRSACDRIASAETSPCTPNVNNEFLKDYLYFPKDNGEYLEKIAAI